MLQILDLNCQLDFSENVAGSLILSGKSPKVTFFTFVFSKLERLCFSLSKSVKKSLQSTIKISF